MSKDYRDKEKLASVYHGKDKTIQETANYFGVSWITIQRWLKRHEIETREKTHAPMRTMADKGYERWSHRGTCVYVHRLLAVAEHGVDEVSGNVVHHKSGIPWDNRPGNLEVLPKRKHHGEHRKADGLERKAIAYAYEFTDMSSREVADTCDYSQNSVLRIHREYFD